MSKLAMLTVVCIAFVVLSVNTVEGLKCVQCMGVQSGNCVDKIPSATDCSVNVDKFCVKFVAKGTGAEAIVRQCSAVELTGCDAALGNEMCHYSCTTDGCNHAHRVLSNSNLVQSLVLAFGLLVASRFM